MRKYGFPERVGWSALASCGFASEELSSVLKYGEGMLTLDALECLQKLIEADAVFEIGKQGVDAGVEETGSSA
jgi:hypothetical protein